MSFLNQQTTLTKVFLIVAISFLVYGYSARIFHIYFFWESVFIGWMIGFVAAIAVLAGWAKRRKLLHKKRILQKVGIGLLCFILLAQTIFLVLLPRTDAYAAAKKYFRRDENIKNELGEIRGFSIVPAGSIQVSSSRDSTVGEADLIIIVKGERKFRRYEVDLVKEAATDWRVYEVHELR